jgi:hypothetical protein
MLSHVALSPRLEDGTPPGSLGSWRRLVLTALIFVAALTACGGSSTGSSSAATATPPATAAAASTPAPHQCPSAGTVGSALGISVPAPTIVPGGGGGAPLSPGATGLGCDYHGPAFNVIIELISNISPSYIAQFSGHFPVPYATVSGVGDQARSFSQSLGGGKDNEGVVATKGSTLVAIDATATPASLMEIESLVNQLL